MVSKMATVHSMQCTIGVVPFGTPPFSERERERERESCLLLLYFTSTSARCALVQLWGKL